MIRPVARSIARAVSRGITDGYVESPGGVLVPGGDPYIANVISLVHFDGTDLSTTIVDEMGPTWTAQANGKLKTDNPKFGTAAFFTDGTGDGCYTGYSADYDLFAKDFTFECFTDPDAVAARWLGGVRGSVGGWNTTTGIHILISTDSSGQLNLQMATSTGSPSTAQSTLAVAVGSYQHIAVSYVDATETAYFAVDGTVQAVAMPSSPAKPSGNGALFYSNLIVGNTTGVNVWKGHIDEGRITAGVARYTEGFTPSSSEFPST